MIVQRNLNGSITVYCLVDGELEHKTYYGYSEASAVQDFIVEHPKSKLDAALWEKKVQDDTNKLRTS